jgi:hypothetical protein
MKTFALWIIAAGLVVSAASVAKAQDSTTTQQTTTTTTTTQDDSSAMNNQSNNSNVRTITGCLQQGDNPKEFALTGQDGSTWEVRSDSVNLADHLGQMVSLTGAVSHANMHGMKEDMKKEAQEHGMDKSATEHGHMTATDVNVVSRSCSR